MEITMNCDVECIDGPCGRSTYIIVNPMAKKVTHFVVRDRAFPYTERIVAVAKIRASSHDGIMLNCRHDEWQRMPPFFETEFAEADVDDYPYDWDDGVLYHWPPSIFRTGYVGITKKQMPLDALDIRRNTRIDATDGHIGRVDEFLVDPNTMNITHLVMTKGHPWGEKDILIPLDVILEFQKETIKLNLTKSEVEALPSLPIHRHFTSVGI